MLCCWCCSVPLERDYPLPTTRPLDLSSYQVLQVPADITGLRKKLRFVCVSDTHTRHSELNIPDGDVLLHCGDASKYRTSHRDVVKMNEYLGRLHHRHKVIISGNHEVCLSPDQISHNQKLYSNAIYLQDSGIDIQGVHIYGTPWHPKRGCCYQANAFAFPHERIQTKWDQIPSDVDILLTHAPPYGIMDRESIGNIGCVKLLTTVTNRVQPKVHIFGHTHAGRGACTLTNQEEKTRGDKQTLFINAAILNDSITLHQPIVFDYYY